jgi:general secretion pathway protein G
MRCVRRHVMGFTFIELVMTLAILGVLALAAVPMVKIESQRARERELRSALTEIREAIDAYKRATEQGRVETKVGESGFPHSLDELVHGVADQRHPQKRLIFFLRRVPRDPFVLDASIAAAETWGLRSYESPPDDPKAGADVFDVYSRSEGAGLNGIPYKQW